VHTAQFDSPLLCAKWCSWTYTWGPRQESDPKTETLHLHVNILEKLVEICAYSSI
jgi:hypothetical protein